MPATYSFFNDADDTALADLNEFELDQCPAVGHTMRFVADGVTAEIVYVVTRIEHVIIAEFMGKARRPKQMIDIYLKRLKAAH